VIGMEGRVIPTRSDGTRDQLFGFLEPTRLVVDQAQQMQGVGIVRIALQKKAQKGFRPGGVSSL